MALVPTDLPATAVETASGRYVDLCAPDPEHLDLVDVARSLSRLCRHHGHTFRFYSVAEHSVLVHDLIKQDGGTEEQRLAGLLHEAAEAYLGDVVAPLKLAMRLDGSPVPADSAYDQLTDLMETAVAEAFGVDLETLTSPEVRRADLLALRIEADALLPSRGQGWHWPTWMDREPTPSEMRETLSWHAGLAPRLACGLFCSRAMAYGFDPFAEDLEPDRDADWRDR